MIGFGLIVGHLVGDFLVQNDWMARNKTSRTPHCFVHCLFYTLAIWAFSFWWMPAWGLAVVFGTHFPIDRWRLARRYMVHISGQKDFATGPLSPWSIIVVDQVFHLIVLFVVGICQFR
jgi:hypothetical protein